MARPIGNHLDVVCVHPSGGRLALCFAPGKCDRSIRRDLQRDLTDLAGLGFHVIGNLLDSYELKKYQLPPLPSSAPRRVPVAKQRPSCAAVVADSPPSAPATYPSTAAKAGLEVLSYPGGIVEMMAPTDMVVAHAYVQQLEERYSQGQGIVMHCRAGVGRAGMMAAMFLLLTGQATDAAQAIRIVRKRRCARAVESRQQEQFVEAYARFLRTDPPAAGMSGP